LLHIITAIAYLSSPQATRSMPEATVPRARVPAERTWPLGRVRLRLRSWPSGL